MKVECYLLREGKHNGQVSGSYIPQLEINPNTFPTELTNQNWKLMLVITYNPLDRFLLERITSLQY
ncbi:uncharacterized protein RAG0_02496 [Rhynchosporium agropyri]|uniref:Uncharacterized protein n=1 Tax=Rhynchosporium agropyri TaxID=914238 RepID=A0A1E1K1D2_9HELO|nr:uncharacterized protein RAG0_02496 [Rhynchosporium agropyri]